MNFYNPLYKNTSIQNRILNYIKDLEEKQYVDQIVIIFFLYNDDKKKLFKILPFGQWYDWYVSDNVNNPLYCFKFSNKGYNRNIRKCMLSFFDLINKKEKILISAKIILTLPFNPSITIHFKLDLEEIITIKNHFEDENINSNIEAESKLVTNFKIHPTLKHRKNR